MSISLSYPCMRGPGTLRYGDLCFGTYTQNTTKFYEIWCHKNHSGFNILILHTASHFKSTLFKFECLKIGISLISVTKCHHFSLTNILSN